MPLSPRSHRAARVDDGAERLESRGAQRIAAELMRLHLIHFRAVEPAQAGHGVQVGDADVLDVEDPFLGDEDRHRDSDFPGDRRAAPVFRHGPPLLPVPDDAHCVFEAAFLVGLHQLQQRRYFAGGRGVGLVGYSPPGGGFPTGAITGPDDFEEGDYRRHSPRFQGENFQRNLGLVGGVRAIADEHDAAPGQVALAWVLAQGSDIVPIPGTKRRSYLEQNVAALELELTSEEFKRLGELTAAGDRYPDMSFVNR